MNLKYSFFLFFILFFSCTSGIIKEEAARQKDNLKSAIINSFSNHYIIKIYPFNNLTGEHDLDYLTDALPNMLINDLKPLENETAYIPLALLDFSVTPNIENIVTASNSFFSNYITNMSLTITQYSEQILTNSSIQLITNSNLITLNPHLKKKKNIKFEIMIMTNTNLIVETNRNISNMIETNIIKLTKEKYIYLITNEFPDITNTICYIPVDVINADTGIQSSNSNILPAISHTNNSLTNAVISNNNIITNIMTNTLQQNFFCSIKGSYQLLEKRMGPNQLKINLKSSYFLDKTNSIDMNITSREDKVPEKMFDFIKPIRKIVLNRETGDIIIISQPEDANIYYDGIFIGKSPIYYPSIPAGKHLFSFLKQGYHQVVIQADILENKTNQISKSIDQLKVGGIVDIQSEPTNALIFIDSYYAGMTPFIATNLTLDIQHRVKIISPETNYFPYYQTFTLNNTNQTFQINASFSQNEGNPKWVRQIYWWSVFGGWGLTFWFVGLNIYSHYQREYYYDLYYSTLNNYYWGYAQGYDNLYQSSTTWGVISAIATLGLTAYALFNEEVYLGLQFDPSSSFKAVVCVRF